MVLDADGAGERGRSLNVLFLAGAEAGVALPAPVASVPKPHGDADDVMPPLLEEDRRHAGVDASGKSNRDIHGAFHCIKR